jgi:hypothetical protein
VLFALIFLSLFVLGWLVCSFLPWLAVSVATRGNAGLGMLPLCLFAGVVAGLAVPLLINDGWPGVWMSFGAALVVPAGLMAIRRMAVPALTPQRPLLTPRPPLAVPRPAERGSSESPAAKPAEERK